MVPVASPTGASRKPSDGDLGNDRAPLRVLTLLERVLREGRAEVSLAIARERERATRLTGAPGEEGGGGWPHLLMLAQGMLPATLKELESRSDGAVGLLGGDVPDGGEGNVVAGGVVDA